MICICPKCGKEFENTTKKKFCSVKCANSRVQTEEQNQRRREKAQSRAQLKQLLNPKQTITRECKVCGKTFVVHSYDPKQKYCTKECASKDKDKYKNCGGYREGSGRSKSGYYKGIFCGSTYELVYVIYRLDHNLPVERFPHILTDGKLKYIPDFIDGKLITEVKGYYQEKVDKKCELAKAQGYDIRVLYKKDLKKEFDWVKEHYQYKSLQELYDDYKPKYKYICHGCGKEFTTEVKRKTDKVFCSRHCISKNKQSKCSEETKIKISRTLLDYNSKQGHNKTREIQIRRKLHKQQQKIINLERIEKINSYLWEECKHRKPKIKDITKIIGLKQNYSTTKWLRRNMKDIYLKYF